jgi:hypothetical protein
MVYLAQRNWHVEDLSLFGLIIPSEFLISPTMYQDGFHSICGKESHKHRIFDYYRLHLCHDHQQNA